MIKIGSFDAKTHFSEIIQKAHDGEEYIITKNGKTMARILPPHDKREIERATEGILALRKKQSATQEEIKEWKEEGRKP